MAEIVAIVEGASLLGFLQDTPFFFFFFLCSEGRLHQIAYRWMIAQAGNLG